MARSPAYKVREARRYRAAAPARKREGGGAWRRPVEGSLPALPAAARTRGRVGGRGRWGGENDGENDEWVPWVGGWDEGEK
jgi:hypothetical protein